MICSKAIRVVAALNYLAAKSFHHGHHLQRKIIIKLSSFLSSL